MERTTTASLKCDCCGEKVASMEIICILVPAVQGHISVILSVSDSNQFVSTSAEEEQARALSLGGDLVLCPPLWAIFLPRYPWKIFPCWGFIVLLQVQGCCQLIDLNDSGTQVESGLLGTDILFL